MDATAATDAAQAVTAIDAATGAEATAPLSAVGSAVFEGLADGSMSIEEARDRLIDGIVDRQLGPDAPASVAESLRTELRSILAGDPTLNELLSPALASAGERS